MHVTCAAEWPDELNEKVSATRHWKIAGCPLYSLHMGMQCRGTVLFQGRILGTTRRYKR